MILTIHIDQLATRFRVFSFQQASEVYSAYRDSLGVGASEFYPGIIRNEHGQTIANISYNGRVWCVDACIYDPFITDPLMRLLAGWHAWLIGYDPFKDDPTITVEQVQKNLDDYKQVRLENDKRVGVAR